MKRAILLFLVMSSKYSGVPGTGLLPSSDKNLFIKDVDLTLVVCGRLRTTRRPAFKALLREVDKRLNMFVFSKSLKWITLRLVENG